MYCGYKPLSFCFAVHNINYSYDLLKNSESFTIAVPGEELAQVTLESGLISGRNTDKFEKFGLTSFPGGDRTECPGIAQCIANIYCTKLSFTEVSDHAIVVGGVNQILRDNANKSKNLLSVSCDTDEVLAHHGIHRIAVKKTER